MAPEHDVQKRVGRKLTKRRKPIRASSVQYPERFKENSDAQEDAAAVTGQNAQYMNQSVFSMIAAAGSKTDFHARFEGESSDSEDDKEISALPPTLEESFTEKSTEDHPKGQHGKASAGASSGSRKEKSAERGALHSLPKLKLRTAKEKNYMSQSVQLPTKEVLSNRESLKGITPRDAPVMSKMLEAQARLDSSISTSEMRDHNVVAPGTADSRGSHVNLATRLMEIFGFEKPEEVISGSSKCGELSMSCY